MDDGPVASWRGVESSGPDSSRLLVHRVVVAKPSPRGRGRRVRPCRGTEGLVERVTEVSLRVGGVDLEMDTPDWRTPHFWHDRRCVVGRWCAWCAVLIRFGRSDGGRPGCRSVACGGDGKPGRPWAGVGRPMVEGECSNKTTSAGVQGVTGRPRTGFALREPACSRLIPRDHSNS